MNADAEFLKLVREYMYAVKYAPEQLPVAGERLLKAIQQIQSQHERTLFGKDRGWWFGEERR